VVGEAVDSAVVLDHVGERTRIHVLDHDPVLCLAAQVDLSALPDAGRVALDEEAAELVDVDAGGLAVNAHACPRGDGQVVEERQPARRLRLRFAEVGEVGVAQALLPVDAKLAQHAIAQRHHLGARPELAERIRHADAVAPEHTAAPPGARPLPEAHRVVDVLHAGTVVAHRDPAPPQLDPNALRVRVERVVHQLADHVVRLVVGHALAEDHVRDGGGFAAAVVAFHLSVPGAVDEIIDPLPRPSGAAGSRAASPLTERDFDFFRSPRGVGQGLGDVCSFDVGVVVPEDLVGRASSSDEPDDGSYRHAHAANARLPAHDSRVPCDAGELRHGTYSVERPGGA